MLTKRQKRFLELLRAMVSDRGYFPTIREIGQELGYSSPATVHSYMRRLFEKGFLKKNGFSWEVVQNAKVIPLMGVVPAGSPHEIFESMGEEVELPKWMAEKETDIIAFRVQGDSMKDAYIQEGDVVVVEQGPHAETGEMVIALLDDSSITLKRLKKKKASYYLVPENPEYSPIHDPFRVVGKVIGVLRKYS